MKTKKQMSESIQLGMVLALAGGFMDAYSYMNRGRVFANAQTGNILLLGIHLAQGQWDTALRYLLPVLLFTLGIVLADGTKRFQKKNRHIHWRQMVLLVEMAAFFFVGFIPQSLNPLANSLISFACGLQAESFQKVHGNAIATTMCIGNLRSAVESIYEYRFTKDRSALKKGLLFLLIIACFALGAIIGDWCVRLFSDRAILLCNVFLFIGFVLMLFDDRTRTTKASKN